ncbi:hypothetical protein CDZ97_10310 [Mameliella alba]|uniref:hypothetical protein n=1 Tax=Mameliella alba TaxID=561184 RepID=UPI000B529F31|nr:hypothetical protein [Mameliella alba]OWV64271.1 hypothetical protein CDZ97_10310 [Mameliella alba]
MNVILTREDADPLWYARAVLADIAAQDGAVVIEACRTIETHSTDAGECRDARELRHRLEGETA